MTQSQEDVVRRVPDMDLGGIFANRTQGLGGLAPRRARPAPPETSEPAAPTPAPPEPASRPKDDKPAAGDSAATESDQPPAERPPSQQRARVARTPRTVKSAKTATPGTPTPPVESAGDVGPGSLRLVIFQLPNALADRLRDTARARGMTYKELTLDAVEATLDELPALIAAQRPKARGAGSPFAGERTGAQVRPEGRRQISIKLTESSIQALDGLADEHEARSRSELVAIALQSYLPA